MKRRSFLQNTLTATTVPFLLGSLPVSVMGKTRLWRALEQTDSEDDRVLVLIQLNGGNDGLNTFIPLDQYAQLSRTRSDLMLPENKVLKVGDRNAFHPKMAGIKQLFDQEKVGVIQDAGYPSPNFSHFRSTDIWTSASDAETVVESGWIGRYLHQDHPEYPENYPNDTFPDPLALTIGSTISQTCQGPVANMGMAVSDPEAFYDLVQDNAPEAPDTPAGHELTYIRQIMRQATRYLDSVSAAYAKGNNLSPNYPERSRDRLGEQLRIVARLISGGLRTKVYVVSLGGFDTHAEQVSPGQPREEGTHAELLQTLSDSVAAFQDDLERLGLEDRVLGMTFSEFGRRVQGNGSYGSDHGTAAPLLLFGSKVNPVIHGQNPEIPEQVDVAFNLPMQHDFRSVYASVLHDWFEMDRELVNEVMMKEFPLLPILKGSNVTTSTEEPLPTEAFHLFQNYPNPFSHTTRIRFLSRRPAQVDVLVFDTSGRMVHRVAGAYFGAGEHELTLRLPRLPRGTYVCKLIAGTAQMSRKMVKL